MNGYTTAPGAIFARMSAIGDATRSRLLLALERHELTVSELCTIVQLPQSTVSRHLKVLSDEGWVTCYAEGTSRRYQMSSDRLDGPARKLWSVVREQIAGMPGADQDLRRLESVIARRRTASQAFFTSAAGQWDRVRGELFGSRADLTALLGLLDPRWVVGDLGCGTAHVAETLSPFVARVIAVDESAAMLSAARKRIADLENVELRRGDLAELPIDAGALDAAILSLVLHYAESPAAILSEAARVLRPGGRLLVVDMMPHDRTEYREKMGHLWQGFSAAQLEEWAADTPLGSLRYSPLPPDPNAKGPSLFVATLTKGIPDLDV